MTQPRQQYRPNVQAGAQLADAAPEIRKRQSKLPFDVLAPYLMLGGMALLLAHLFLPAPWMAVAYALGMALAAVGAGGYFIYLYLQPVPIVLPSGNSVPRPRSRVLLSLFFMVPVVAYSLVVTRFDLGMIISRGHHMTGIMEKIFQPDFSYFNSVWPPLIDTIKMSLLGSAAGSLLSLPVAVLASANINKSKLSLGILRVIINIVRTLPTLIIASVSALIFGLGTFAGTVAISFFTFGVVAKMLYESIETIDMGPFEAMESMGATKFQAFWSACMPQILPTYLSHSLYSFEMNIRAASILGYVGAGGLGILIAERVGWRDYQGLGMVLLALFVTVLLIDNLSGYLRKKLS